MTTLSRYLNAEETDPAEPPTFYRPNRPKRLRAAEQEAKLAELEISELLEDLSVPANIINDQ